jgi:hypothetical protein
VTGRQCVMVRPQLLTSAAVGAQSEGPLVSGLCQTGAE